MNKKETSGLLSLFGLIVAVFLILVGVIAIIQPSAIYQGPEPTVTFEAVNCSKANQLIGTIDNITVIDVRGLEGCGQCQFNKGHLPMAFMFNNPEDLFNVTNTLLVYSIDGVMGYWFCEQLMGNVYGDVYNLEGGWNAWSNYYIKE